MARDGQMILLGPGTPGVVDEVPTGRIGLDGEILIDIGEEAVPQRRRLSYSGAVSVALALSDSGEIVSDPDVKLAGLPSTTRDGRSMDDLVADAALEVLESLPKQRRRDPDLVETAVERGVRAAVNGVWGKKPTCHVIVLVV
jgi:ribonuclease J